MPDTKDRICSYLYKYPGTRRRDLSAGLGLHQGLSATLHELERENLVRSVLMDGAGEESRRYWANPSVPMLCYYGGYLGVFSMPAFAPLAVRRVACMMAIRGGVPASMFDDLDSTPPSHEDLQSVAAGLDALVERHPGRKRELEQLAGWLRAGAP